MADWNVETPINIKELLEHIESPTAKIIAGGTDLLPRLRRTQQEETVNLIDMSSLTELRYIREVGNSIEIGALTTHADISSSSIIKKRVPALAEACGRIGAVQTRTRGTLGGNLVNASPAADSAVPLLCLESQVLLSSTTGERCVSLTDFFTGPGQTSLQKNEFVQSVQFTPPTAAWGFVFQKLGRRNGMAIAIASVAVLVELDTSRHIKLARVALGSVAPTPVRSLHAETILTNGIPDPTLFSRAADAMLADIHPISDIRASGEYRQRAVKVLLERALVDAVQQAESRLS